MGIFAWLALGLVAGAIAKAIHRGPEPQGLLGTEAVGLAGALVGGAIASTLGIDELTSFFSLGTWLIAILGALLLLAIYRATVDRRSRPPHDHRRPV